MAAKRTSSNSDSGTEAEQPSLMPPDAYHRILSGLELLDLRLEKMTASHDADLPAGIPAKLEIKVESALLPDDQLNAATTLTLRGVRGRKAILTISATYRVRFSSREKVGEDFFRIFKDINLPLHVWPFFRELAQTTTARMGLPPLTLPLVKTGLPPAGQRKTESEADAPRSEKRPKLAN